MKGAAPSIAGLTLISHPLCPYIQRAAIVLAEKGVPFERLTIDLNNKPDWFLAISPAGKVPLMMVPRDNGASQPCSKALSFVITLKKRRRARACIRQRRLNALYIADGSNLAPSILSDLWEFETAVDQATFEHCRKCLINRFAKVEDALINKPFFAGDRFSIVDATFAPIFRYFDTFDAISDTKIFANLPRVSSWRESLSWRDNVRHAVPADYADRLRRFLLDHNSYLLRAGQGS